MLSDEGLQKGKTLGWVRKLRAGPTEVVRPKPRLFPNPKNKRRDIYFSSSALVTTHFLRKRKKLRSFLCLSPEKNQNLFTY